MKFIITGGNSKSFAEKLDADVLQDSMLVEKGLNYILEYNYKQ
jgi:pantothenate kinase type III